MRKLFKYAGYYHDPNHSPLGMIEECELFYSVADARRILADRIRDRHGSARRPVVHDGMISVSAWSDGTVYLWYPEEGMIDLYSIAPTEFLGWGYLSGDMELRLTVGSRGGIRTERA